MRILKFCKQQTTWYLLFLLVIMSTVTTYGQMEVKDVATPPYDAESLIYNELLGEGVQITNVVYEGTNSSVGFFSNAGNSVGLESGVLLTTGAVSTVGANIGVEQVGSVQASVDNGSIVQDVDMSTLADFSLFNISKYTITFIPSSDSISFRYVFASEEYPEFVCSDYNDIFGFFISGPGINGTFENNAENIALIPGTNLPVKINNVNGGMVGAEGIIDNCQNGNGYLDFSEFYNDNDGSSQQPVFDGFLKVFTASAKVIPCSTYTIKLVVADQGDPQRDSGVFLEAKSFSSKFISANVKTESTDGTIIEGCTDALIEIEIPSPLATDLDLDINIFGDAIEGVDFNNFPDAIIPAGQTSTTINISALEDGVIEGIENIFFDIQLNQCFRDTFSLLINDNLIPEIDLGKDTTVCAGTTLTLNAANLNDNLPPSATFNASNTNVPIISPPPGVSPMPASVPLTVMGVNPLTLGPDLIQSVCLNIDHNRLEDLEIYLQAPDGQLMALSTDNGGTAADYSNTCFTVDAATSIRDGVAPFSGSFLPEGQWENLWANDSPINGIWRLIVIDEQFGFNGILNDWSITFNQVASYSYSWENTAGLSCTDCPNPTANPLVSTDYILHATNNYGCISSDTLSATIYEDISSAPTVTCIDQTFDALTFGWDTVPGGLSYEFNINNAGWTPIANNETTFQVENLSLGETVNFAVRATGGCNSMESSTSCVTLNCTAITLANQDVRDLTCADAIDGQIQITAMGDNGPFDYDLNGTTNTTGLFENLAAGDYSIIVTDALDCSQNFDFTINAPALLTLTPMTIADIGCEGEAGRATVGITGGTAPYIFAWDTGETDSIITKSVGGDFMVTVTDANNCEVSGIVTIADKIPMILTFESTATCQNTTDGNLTVNVAGGAIPYTYAWDGISETTATLNDLAAGTYTVTVKDANDCMVMATATVDAIPLLTAPDVVCGTVTNEAITFVWAAIPDATNYEVNVNNNGWENASDALAHTITGLALGQTVNIEVRVIGACNPPIGTMSCTTIDCTPINITDDIRNVSCNGRSDGSVILNATGDNPPFQYNLNGNNNTTGIFNGLAVGNYTIIVTDALDCSNNFAFTINSPNALTLTPITIADIGCEGEEGRATVGITGGTAPYTFTWDAGETDSIITKSAGGNFMVTVTDANNCEVSGIVTIADKIPMVLTFESTATCQNTTDGNLTVNVAGGAIPYTYAWDGISETTATLNDLAAGTYTVTVKDANDCMVMATTTVDAIPLLTAPDVVCGTVTNEAITFVWAAIPDATNYEVNVDNNGWENASDALAHTVTGLALGQTVNIEVRAIGACNPPIGTMSCTTIDCTPINITDEIRNVSCNGRSDGSVILTATGDNPPFQYNLNGNNNTTGIFNGLAVGNYTIIVTDALDCSNNFAFTINSPNALTLTPITIADIGCEGEAGRATVEITGGTAPYTFTWDTGETDSIITKSTGGNFMVTITDANNCEVSDMVTIADKIPMVLSFDSTSTCIGENLGSITANVTGGAMPYSFAWNVPANGQTTATINNLAPDTYEVTITDANNCTIVGSTNVLETPTSEMPEVSCGTITGDAITFIWNVQTNANSFEVNVDNGGWISPSAPLAHTVNGLSLGQTISIEVRAIGACNPPIGTTSCTTIDCSVIDLTTMVQNVSCNGQSDGIITVTATGDNPPFQYELNGESNTLGIFNDLVAGSYTVTITDNLGCVATTQLTVTEPMILNSTIAISQQETCDQLGSATISFDGGTAPFSILWSDGSTELLNTNLAGGNHTVTVTDAAGCTTQSTIDITPYEEMTATITATDNSCSEPPVGSVTVEVQNGSGEYTYQWNDANRQTTNTANNLTAGNYIVTITDASNCTITTMGVVRNPSDISIDTIFGSAVTCVGNTDGQAIAYISGGNGIINFAWEDGQTSETAINLSAGNHNLTVSDSAGCMATATVMIEEPLAIALSAPTIILPCSESLTDLDLSVRGGTGAYTYNWNTGSTTEDLTDLTAGMYSVTVTDANNCTAMLSNEIQAAVNFSLTLNKTDIQCANVIDGAIEAVIEGGNSPYNYEWSNGVTTTTLNNVSDGTYDLTVTDVNGCVVTATESIVAPPSIQFVAETIQPICEEKTGSILATATGGTGELELFINEINYGSQFQVDNLSAGIYSVAIKDNNSCIAPTQDVQISVIPSIDIELTTEMVISLGDSITLRPIITNGLSPFDYFWESSLVNGINCLDCANPTIRPFDNTNYSLEVVDMNGCIATTSLAVKVSKERKIYAPNIFSPNQDGINEQFMLYGKQTGIIKNFQIFDRWGNLVFERTNLTLNEDNGGWDGTYQGQRMNPSVFGWFAEIEFLDGSVEIFKGDVTLVK